MRLLVLICVALYQKPGLSATGIGSIDHRVSTGEQNIRYVGELIQPMTDDRDVGGDLRYVGPLDADAPPVVLDGAEFPSTGDISLDVRLCGEVDCASYSTNDILFAPCNPVTYALERHTITFDGGSVVLDFRKGVSMAGTEPGAFVAASGALDGTPFEQTDYWKLVYNPDHHHFLRRFAVLFDTPIGDACGIKVEDVEPWDDPSVPAQVHTIECDLTDIEARDLVSQVFERME